MKPGDIFALSKVRKAIENYTKLYGQFGYINFTASPDIEPDNKRRVINLALDFEEDNQFTVHRIEFSGNTKTRDKVIRRELLLNEGAIFSSQLWDYSVLKMNQLGFFDEVKKEDYDIKQNAKDKTVDILVKVKEKGKNSIGLSGGISGLAGNFRRPQLRHEQLPGPGRDPEHSNMGHFSEDVLVWFHRALFFDQPITAGFTVFKSDYNYNQIRQLASLQGINPNLLAQSQVRPILWAELSAEFRRVHDVCHLSLAAQFCARRLDLQLLPQQLAGIQCGVRVLFPGHQFQRLDGPIGPDRIISSQIMPTYLYSTINSAWTPTRGKYLYAALASPDWAGTLTPSRPSIEAKYFHPVRNVRSDHPTAIGMRFLVSSD